MGVVLFVAFMAVCGAIVVRLTEGSPGERVRPSRPVRAPRERATVRESTLPPWAARTLAVTRLVLFVALAIALFVGALIGAGAFIAKALHK